MSPSLFLLLLRPHRFLRRTIFFSAGGSLIVEGVTFKFDGKDDPVTGSMPGGADMIAIKRVNTHTMDATQRKDGKVLSTAKVEISKDGETATVTANNKDVSGQPIGYVSVFDKQ